MNQFFLLRFRTEFPGKLAGFFVYNRTGSFHCIHNDGFFRGNRNLIHDFYVHGFGGIVHEAYAVCVQCLFLIFNQCLLRLSRKLGTDERNAFVVS